MQLVNPPHEREVGCRHRPGQVIDAPPTDGQRRRLLVIGRSCARSIIAESWCPIPRRGRAQRRPWSCSRASHRRPGRPVLWSDASRAHPCVATERPKGALSLNHRPRGFCLQASVAERPSRSRLKQGGCHVFGRRVSRIRTRLRPVGRQGSDRRAAKAIPEVGPRMDASRVKAWGCAFSERIGQRKA